MVDPVLDDREDDSGTDSNSFPGNGRRGRRGRSPRRNAPTSRHERELFEEDPGAIVAGLDEVGRGAWAGPVTVGVVVWRPDVVVRGCRDSKLVPPDRRTVLAERIRGRLPWAVGHSSNAEIDEIGMTSSLRLASLRALVSLEAAFGVMPSHVLLDGTQDFLRGVVPVTCRPKADLHCVSVAMASIVAKVARDQLMTGWSASHPPYGFDQHKGYPAPLHLDALRDVGACSLHRLSWAPLREARGLEPFDRVVMDGSRAPAEAVPTLF